MGRFQFFPRKRLTVMMVLRKLTPSPITLSAGSTAMKAWLCWFLPLGPQVSLGFLTCTRTTIHLEAA